MATLRVRASATMVLIYSSWNNPVSAPEELMFVARCHLVRSQTTLIFKTIITLTRLHRIAMNWHTDGLWKRQMSNQMCRFDEKEWKNRSPFWMFVVKCIYRIPKAHSNMPNIICIQVIIPLLLWMKLLFTVFYIIDHLAPEGIVWYDHTTTHQIIVTLL